MRPSSAGIEGIGPHLAVDQALALAAAIVGSEDGPEESEAIRHRYAANVRDMHSVAEQNLPLTRSDIEFVSALQTLLALEGVPTQKNHLESIADGEVGLECPNCGQFILSAVDGATGPDGSKAEDPIPQATGIPVDPKRLDPAAGRSYSIAIAHQRPIVAAGMLRLFGRVSCPRCREQFDVASAL